MDLELERTPIIMDDIVNNKDFLFVDSIPISSSNRTSQIRLVIKMSMKWISWQLKRGTFLL